MEAVADSVWASPLTAEHHQDDGFELGWPSRRPIVIGDATPQLEPTDIDSAYRTNKFRPDTILDGWSHGPFTVRAASMRGHLHRYNGAPRQDDYQLALDPERQRLIVTVADGVSSAMHSHIGATTAVEYARQLLQRNATDAAAINWHELIQHTAYALTPVAAQLLAPEEPDAQQVNRLLATTLTCAVCEPAPGGALSAWLVAVGDSGAWVLSNGEFTNILGAKTADAAGITSSAVSGLPLVPNTVEPVHVMIEPHQVLLVGTDGFGDPLGGGQGPVGALFNRILAERAPSLLEFAHALDFAKETYLDDRTLVAVWPRGADNRETS